MTRQAVGAGVPKVVRAPGSWPVQALGAIGGFTQPAEAAPDTAASPRGGARALRASSPRAHRLKPGLAGHLDAIARSIIERMASPASSRSSLWLTRSRARW